MWLNRLTLLTTPLFGLYWDFRFEAEGDRIPRDVPLILAPNHTSFLDPWFLGWVFPRQVHHLINREWYERSTAWNLFFRANGTVPVSPSDPEATLQAVRGVLDRNDVICIFPEGKVSADGRLRRFRSGIGWFASVTGVPVIPVGIEGAFDSLPKGKKFPRRARITIRAGKPMHYPNPGPDPNRRETFAFVQQIRREVERLTGVPEPGDG
ncbi:MAG: 1-acyl-sn-glycerol-3-phosphate acyltransferase [Acidobacteria bacterium]|uniref:1-acyl-sn-glycerol-3-phosphate acyltransferase n=1 Tax=Candidatus Polarisedimenticola svalbardensis TaxID=2886004 RepID=A0A8J7C1G5_9BACT|nr:1-acyl-sn-glycerol-3-phosphate acyltransferase [Candidatus Polarisedimenticola svalbardensis]